MKVLYGSYGILDLTVYLTYEGLEDRGRREDAHPQGQLRKVGQIVAEKNVIC